MEEHLVKFVKIAKEKGLEIVDVDFVSSEQMDIKIARLDHSPVTLDDCSEAGYAFGEAVGFSIGLDVSSAGAEREIDAENFDTLEGQYVLVKFKNPTQGADHVFGTVVAVEDEELVISYQVMHRHKDFRISKDNIAMCRLTVKV